MPPGYADILTSLNSCGRTSCWSIRAVWGPALRKLLNYHGLPVLPEIKASIVKNGHVFTAERDLLPLLLLYREFCTLSFAQHVPLLDQIGATKLLAGPFQTSSPLLCFGTHLPLSRQLAATQEGEGSPAISSVCTLGYFCKLICCHKM